MVNIITNNVNYKYRVLFVCSGNIFRSMSAKYLSQEFLREKNIFNIFVDSAGIIARPQSIALEVLEELDNYKVDVRNHKQKKLTKDILDKFDLVVAMGINHVEFIKKHFNKDVPLFLEIVNHKKKGLLDTGEVLDNIHGWRAKEYNKSIIRKIYRYIPKFWDNFELFIDQ